MELRVTGENILINEVIYDGCMEVGLESDFVIPDYCKDIERILKCQVTPRITSKEVEDGKLTVNGTAYIRLLYLSEQKNQICCFENQIPFGKTIDMRAKVDTATIKVRLRTDYINCRAISQRRIEVRGALTVCAKITAQRQDEIINNIAGGGVQAKKTMVQAGRTIGVSEEEFTVREEYQLGEQKPPIANILRLDTNASVSDYKVITNKIIVKGEAKITFLYQGEYANENPQLMEYTLPISQILNLEGVDEDCSCDVSFEIMQVMIEPKNDMDGEARNIALELKISGMAKAYKNSPLTIINDVYSTGYDCHFENKLMSFENPVQQIKENFSAKASIDLPQDIHAVLDLCCRVKDTSCKLEERMLTVVSNVEICALVADNQGEVFYLEKMETVTHNQTLENAVMGAQCEGMVFVANCSYTMSGVDRLVVNMDLVADINITSNQKIPVVSNVEIDENNPKKTDPKIALTLYYADSGESVWDIAKRYNTSAQAVIDENDLKDEYLTQKRMILIPLVQ